MTSDSNFSRTSSLIAVLAIISLSAGTISLAAVDEQTGQNQGDLGKTRSLAESQHEIVVLLLGKKQFEQALTEANKIFAMKWPSDQEPLLLKELLRLSDKFMHSGQSAYGVRLLESNQGAFKIRASQASIWKEKGYLLKRMGRSDQALECFRQAQRLER